MKSFFKMVWTRIKKLVATILSVPFLLLLIAIYVNIDGILIFTLMVTMLAKRHIEKIKEVGYWKK